jgi:hypothetical protein
MSSNFSPQVFIIPFPATSVLRFSKYPVIGYYDNLRTDVARHDIMKT